MAPWDEAVYFDNPVVTFTSLAASASAQIMGASPMRIGCLISPNVVTGGIMLRPDVVPTAAQPGLNLSGNVITLQMLFRELGSLVQRAWFALNTSASTQIVTVIEARLKQWPTEKPPTVEGIAALARILGIPERES